MENKTLEITEEYPAPSEELAPYMKHYGRSREEQIKINQKAVEMLRAWREEASRRAESLTQEELEKQQQEWEAVEKTIDQYRSRKLFT